MQKIILILSLLLLLSGCINQQSQNSYLEGTSLTVGLYIPLNGSLYGLQFVNFISGKRLSINTNSLFKVKSSNSITNDVGVFNTNTIIE